MEVIEKIINEQIVETIADNIGVTSNYKDDFIQEMYLILLEYDKKALEDIYNKGDIKYFVSKICTNNWFSKTSPFYKNYKKYDNSKGDTDYPEGVEEDNE